MAPRRLQAGVHSSRLSASDIAAGGGSGGILVYLINGWVGDPNLKSLLLYLVPAISILITGAYSAVVSFALNSLEYNLARRALGNARKHLEEIEGDGRASETHKKAARERVEEAERDVMMISLKSVPKPR
ncbi:hypothetical protein [Rhizobium sp. NLR22b]|uniref:hypothetical protein n=1 Tax=Rhizobium sp. NLR22b TaxID=2731115 RepID=UPI001C83F331|nr:hypothetical protein [Rhizobium sp. NLR22b]